MNKKGSVQDVLWIGIGLIIIAATLLICFTVYAKINEKFQASPDLPDDSKAISNVMEAQFTGTMDNAFLYLTIVLSIAALILAALVRVHPLFFVAFMIALLFIIFLAGIFSNIYQEMAANTDLLAYADQLTYTTTIMSFLPLIIGVVGFLLSLVMFKLWSDGE